MCASRTRWFTPKINVEIGIDRQTALIRIAVNLEQVRSGTGEIGIKLVIPTAQQRIGDIEALSIQAELQHLRTAPKAVPLDHFALTEDTATPDLPCQLRLCWVADVVLADVAVQPVGQIKIAVIHRKQQIRDERRNRKGPTLDLNGRNAQRLFDCPLSVGFIPVPECAAERRANVTVRAVRVVMEAYFERDQPFFAQIDALNDASLLPIPEVNAASVLPGGDIIEVKARHVCLGRTEFAADHTFWRG